MIARVWTATATEAGAKQYSDYFRAHVLPALADIEGYEGAMLIQRPIAQLVELNVTSFWTSEEAIRRFAGDDPTRAVVGEQARQLLTAFDDVVRHFDVVVWDRQPL